MLHAWCGCRRRHHNNTAAVVVVVEVVDVCAYAPERTEFSVVSMASGVCSATSVASADILASRSRSGVFDELTGEPGFRGGLVGKSAEWCAAVLLRDGVKSDEGLV